MSQHRTESIHSVGLDRKGRDGEDGGHGHRGWDCKASCGRGYLHGELKKINVTCIMYVLYS